MRPLIYKELKLAIHPLFLFMPVLLGLLMFIPGWIFLLVFMYFFWISAPQIYSNYIAQQDHSFSMMLPISKAEFVKSKIIALFVLEGLHLFFGFLFGFIHNLIYGQFNWFHDINIAFVGVILVLFTIFNIVFLPQYFKTGYYFGKPVIYGIVATMIYGFVIEFSAFKYTWYRDLFEGPLLTQIIILVVGALIAVGLNWYAWKISVKNYLKS